MLAAIFLNKRLHTNCFHILNNLIKYRISIGTYHVNGTGCAEDIVTGNGESDEFGLFVYFQHLTSPLSAQPWTVTGALARPASL